MCKFCNIRNYERAVYYDSLCFMWTDTNTIYTTYNWHQTPKPDHINWIELQIKIIASKRWGKEWSIKFENHPHPLWTIRPLPWKERKIFDRDPLPINKTKRLE